MRGTFASAVKAVAAMRPSVMSGAIGAAAACSLAFGAMAAERADVTAPDAGIVKISADFYGRGLDAIAQADLSALSPRAAVMTLKAMARGTLKHGPAAAYGDAPEWEDVRKAALGNGVSTMSDFLTNLAERPVITARVTQMEAETAVRSARRELRGHGVETTPSKLDFGGIVEEMERVARSKSGGVSSLARMGADGADIVEMLDVAQGAKANSIPAKSALLSSLADHFLSDASLPTGDRDRLVKAMAVQVAADGALQSVSDMWEAEGQDLKPERIARMAEVSKASLATLSGNDPNLAPEVEPEATAAPGR